MEEDKFVKGAADRDQKAQYNEIVQTALLYLDPISGKLTKEQKPLNLDSLTNELVLDSLLSNEDQTEQDDEKISLKRIYKKLSESVSEPKKIENFIKALVDPVLATQACGVDEPPLVDVDAAKLKQILDKEHITEGFEVLDRVEDLQTKFALATRKTQLLELNLWDLTEKIRLLEHRIQFQDQQILDTQNRQVEQDAFLLSPMRTMYLRHFHDQVRERICQRLSTTSIYARHQRALRLRVHDKEKEKYGVEHAIENNLWKLMQETHSISPQFFSKFLMWNQFGDEIVQDEEVVKLLGLSPESIKLTRFGRGDLDDEQNLQNLHDSTSALKNEHVFAELVTRQNDEQRPLYTELYEFLFNAHPEIMNFKAISMSQSNQ